MILVRRLLLGSGSLVLLGSANLLGTVLAFFSLLAGRLLDLDETMLEEGRKEMNRCQGTKSKTYTSETVLWFKLLGRVQRVVDQGESSRLATTESSTEAKHENVFLIGLVELGQLFAEVVLGDVGTARVQDVDDLCGHEGW